MPSTEPTSTMIEKPIFSKEIKTWLDNIDFEEVSTAEGMVVLRETLEQQLAQVLKNYVLLVDRMLTIPGLPKKYTDYCASLPATVQQGNCIDTKMHNDMRRACQVTTCISIMDIGVCLSEAFAEHAYYDVRGKLELAQRIQADLEDQTAYIVVRPQAEKSSVQAMPTPAESMDASADNTAAPTPVEEHVDFVEDRTDPTCVM